MYIILKTVRDLLLKNYTYMETIYNRGSTDFSNSKLVIVYLVKIIHLHFQHFDNIHLLVIYCPTKKSTGVKPGDFADQDTVEHDPIVLSYIQPIAALAGGIPLF